MIDGNDLTHEIIGCAIEVHRELGPGLLESTYEAALARELQLHCIPFQQQVPMPLCYKGEDLDCGYRVDLLVGSEVIVEIKSAASLLPIHEAQLMTYLNLAGKRTGLLINFNVLQLRDGIRRFVL